jgi:uncharacterized protein YaaW (UPF0174 family)
MANSTAFEWLCEELEKKTMLDRLEARGTVRIAIKQAGLEASCVSSDQIAVVLARVLPRELADRGIEDADACCEQAAAGLAQVQDGASPEETPEAVFARLAG